MFRAEGEEIGVVMMFLAGEGKVFERLVNSVGENLAFGWAGDMLLSLGFFIRDKTRPSIEMI
jgi:hypothetical protein